MFFSHSDIEGLKELTGANEVDESHVYGSGITPGTVMGDKGKKEIAPPNSKVEVKVNNRAEGGGATTESIKEEKEKKSYADPKNVIYKEEEVNKEAESIPDDRPEPECEILFKQHVGTEDVYLGLSDRDPSSNHCDCILVKVSLPDTQFKNVQLDILNGVLIVQSPNFSLKKVLGYTVDKTRGKAQFDSDKSVLNVTLPVVKKEYLDQIIDSFCGPDDE